MLMLMLKNITSYCSKAFFFSLDINKDFDLQFFPPFQPLQTTWKKITLVYILEKSVLTSTKLN